MVNLLRLRDFRNYRSLEFQLSEGLNLLSGANAQGKTSVLEALYLASSTRLLRGIRDAEAIREGADAAEVTVELSLGHTQIAIQLAHGQRKRALLNGLGLPRAADLLGRLPSVCLSSADLPIVQGGASERRLFLDIEISQLFPAYVRRLATYKRALDHRNALLKHRPMPEKEAFEPWEAALSESGFELRFMRDRFVEELSPIASNVHAGMGGGEVLALSYRPKDSAHDQAALLAELERTRRGDWDRGATSVGPHRDDLAIMIGGQEARLFGSQGQQRTAIIALKLGTHELGKQRMGEAPLLLLDDMLSDLDAARRSRLVEWILSESGQAVLTCTETESVGKELASRASVFEVVAGTLTPR